MRGAAQQSVYDGKLVVIQLLRALAAFVVAAVHLGWGFADKIDGGLGLGASPGRASQAAVLLFFLISGYIMVIASKPLYGAAGGWRIFATGRLVRIAPIYWIATLSLIAVLALLFGRAFISGEVMRSLALIPYWPAEGAQAVGLRPVPILWPGWTLFYELVFYALFGIGIAWGRRAAVLGAALGCVRAGAGGARHRTRLRARFRADTPGLAGVHRRNGARNVDREGGTPARRLASRAGRARHPRMAAD